MHNLRSAVRRLFRSPRVTLVAAGSLALGMGATTAVFSLADALLLHPLPALRDPGSLVAVAAVQSKEPERLRQLTWADYMDYAGQAESALSLAAMADCDLSLMDGRLAERVAGLAVSSRYFGLLALRPASGRLLSNADDAAYSVVLGHGLWQRRFGGNPEIVGSTLGLNGQRFTVVGIAPAGFTGTDLTRETEVWIPLTVYSKTASGVLASFAGKQDRTQTWLEVIGRLSPGTTFAQARQALEVVSRRLAATYPEAKERGIRMMPLSEAAFEPRNRPLLKQFSLRLLAVSALVLAVAVVNVAGLLLSRALARQKEIRLRLCLGASRGQLIRLLLAEGSVLTGLGLAGGLVLAAAVQPLLEKLDLPVRIAVRDYTLSWQALGFTGLVALASGLALSLVPATQALRATLVPTRAGRRGGFGFREALASVQVALTLLAVIVAGLTLRTMAWLAAVEPGFKPDHVLAVSVDLSAAGYEGEQIAGFYRDLLERLRRVPGVEGATMASALPAMGNELVVDLSVTPMDSDPGDSRGPSVRHALVGDRFFQTVGMTLLKGRDFNAADGPAGAGVLIINETAARLLWGTQDPLGRRLRLAETEEPFEVIGVVADATYGSLKESSMPVLYLSHAQAGKSFLGLILAPEMTLFIRTRGEPMQALGPVRAAVRGMDSRVPVFKVATLSDLLAATVGVERQAAVLYSGLALVALALSLFGLWGVLVQAALERTREIAVRIACGARPGHIRNLILHRSLAIALPGAIGGLALALPACKLMADQLYGVGPGDPFTRLAATLVTVGLSLLTGLPPGIRAARTSPAVVLREE